jgi:uncharacterized membrane protein
VDESLTARFWEVDFLRGWALIMMILFHSVFDLGYFGVWEVDIYSGFWFYFARLTASLFLLLVGVSLVLSYSRAERKARAEQFRFRLLKRSIWIFSLGMGITLATYLVLGNGFIIFGVLHLIGVSLLLAYPFLKLHRLNAIFGLLFILVGLYFQNLSIDYPWLLWLGLVPPEFYSLDYFPIFPWFGVILMGIALGDLLYRGYRRRIALPNLSGSSSVKPVAFLGRNSLAIYLIHQPVLIILFYLLGYYLPRT